MGSRDDGGRRIRAEGEIREREEEVAVETWRKMKSRQRKKFIS